MLPKFGAPAANASVGREGGNTVVSMPWSPASWTGFQDTYQIGKTTRDLLSILHDYRDVPSPLLYSALVRSAWAISRNCRASKLAGGDYSHFVSDPGKAHDMGPAPQLFSPKNIAGSMFGSAAGTIGLVAGIAIFRAPQKRIHHVFQAFQRIETP